MELFMKLVKERDALKTQEQKECPYHCYLIIPKTGRYTGTAFWRCQRCNRVVQAS